MGLLPCYECGNSISEFAQTCTKCGAPNNQSTSSDYKSSNFAVEDENRRAKISKNRKIDSLVKIDEFHKQIEDLQGKETVFNLVTSAIVLLTLLLFGLSYVTPVENLKSVLENMSVCGLVLFFMSSVFSTKGKQKKLVNRIKFERNWNRK